MIKVLVLNMPLKPKMIDKALKNEADLSKSQIKKSTR